MPKIKMPKKVLEHKRLFTLVEMLVVIAIVSILSAMLMPSLQGAIQAAQTATCANNMKQTGIALFMYTSDNHGFLPSLLQTKDINFTDAIAEYAQSKGEFTRNWASTGPYAYYNLYTPSQQLYGPSSVFICPTAAGDLSGSSITSPELFLSNYSPTLTTQAPGSSPYQYAWWRKSGQTNTSPNSRRLNNIEGKIIVGEQRYSHSFNVPIGGKTRSVCYNQRQSVIDWCAGVAFTGSPYEAGTVHASRTSGNWLYKDGHVSFSYFDPLLIHSGNDFFVGSSK